MLDPIVFGFPRSTFVQIVRLVLTHKNVSYTFRDLEPEMGKPTHLALHPFNRVPILQHADFTVYETSAIVNYVEETFDSVALRPASPRERARMDQWISAVNSYYYPYMIYHVSDEQRVKFLILRVWDLSGVERAERGPRARHSIGREGGAALASKDRRGPPSR